MVHIVRSLVIILCLGGVLGLLGEIPTPVHAQEAPIDTGDTRSPAVSSDSIRDAQLQARLEGIYDQVEAFRTIDVTVRRGVVQLKGRVLQSQQAVEAAELARQLEGVVYVSNKVSAETDLADRVTPAVSRLQGYGKAFVRFLPLGLIALLVMFVTIGIVRWVGTMEVPEGLPISSLVWGLVRRVFQFVLAFTGLVVTFDLMGVTSLVGALLGTAGVAGLAVGFAFRDIIENYLAGILLSLRQPFRINDVVSVADQEGRVVRLTARELVLLTLEGNHVRLPNATVFKGVIINYTLNAQRLFDFDVGIGSEEDLEEVMQVGIDTLKAMKGVLSEPPPYARVRQLGDSAVIVRFHGWVDQREADFHKVKSQALRLVKLALEEADLEMPEPTYRLQLYQAGEVPRHDPKMRTGSLEEQAEAIDVDPDRRLEQKVEEELRSSDESNLLSQ